MRAPLRSAAFEAFVAPARARPALWRCAAGVGLAVACHLAGALAVTAAAVALLRLAGQEAAPEAILLGRTPAGLVAILASFAFLGAGTILAAALLHGRSAGTLFGPAAAVGRGFGAGAGLVAAVYGGALLLPGDPQALSPALPAGVWLAWAPAAVLAIAVQTGAEEILFRGYLQTQLAARFASPWAWMVLPSALFGLVHWDATTWGANAPLVVAATALFGLAAADLTARTGSVGLAWGVHFANNLFALLLAAPEGPLDGLALWRIGLPPDAPGTAMLILVDMAGLLVVWLAARLLLARRG